ncbi:MAG: DUF1018 domain-containing protein [Deltaproteobacteria bacterium]|nr:DUF1018 domain-containing protein [Deltaproteobacteria bacterium]
MTLTKPQYAKLHCLAAQVFGRDRDLYEEWLHNLFGVRSSMQIDNRQFNRALKDLYAKGAVKLRKKRSGGPAGHKPQRSWVTAVSREQVHLIYHLAEDVGWYNKSRLFGFINARISGGLRDKPEELSNYEAQRLIEALIAMKDRNFRNIQGGKRKEKMSADGSTG